MDENNDITPGLDEIESSSDVLDVIDLTMDRFLATASVEAVYGEPVQNGDTTIIPCAEVLAGMGFGLGFGMGGDKAKEGDKTDFGSGSGGGGGGRTFSRPVAVIVASPNGVRVEPVIDVTKIALAALTAGGFMVSMVARMMRAQPPDHTQG
jgi:uncharacterized spore protein YtfJ